MKVLFISHYDNMYGANRALLSLILGMQESGVHQPFVTLPAEGEFTEALRKAGVPYYICDITQWQAIYKEPVSFMIKKQKRKKQIAEELELLYAHYRNVGIDVIHSNSSVIGTGAMLAEKLGCAHVWHIREFAREHYGMRYFYPQDTVDRYYNSAKRLILISDALKEYYDRLYPSAHTVRIYDGVDAKKETAASETGKSTEDVVFVYTGYLFPKKHQLEVLKAAAALKKEGVSGFKLILAGSGEAAYTKKLEDYISANSLKEAKLSGFVDDVASLLKKCDVGIIASEYEGFGLVTVEYMLDSMPVIGYRSGATPEIVSDGTTGILYNDIHGLAEAMKKMIEDPALRKSMGAAGKERALREFTAENNLCAVTKLFDVIEGE